MQLKLFSFIIPFILFINFNSIIINCNELTEVLREAAELVVEEVETYSTPLMILPGPRCTGGGDIFPQRFSGSISGCKLYCRSKLFGFGHDCAWRADNFKQHNENNINNNNLEAIIPEWQQHSRFDVILLCITNLFWFPALLYCVRRRVWIEPLLMIFVIVFVSLFHQCKEGLICILPYEWLYFLDSSIGLAGLFSMFIHSSALRNTYAVIISYSLMLILAVITGYISVIHQDPHEMSIIVTISLTIGISIVVLRYALFDRDHKPAINWHRAALGWSLAFLGMSLMKFQYLYHYPYIHACWHSLAAVSGYCVITATEPAGYFPRWPRYWPWIMDTQLYQPQYSSRNHQNGFKPNRKIV